MPSYYYKKVRRAPVYGKRKRGGGRRKSVSVYKRRQSYRRRGGMRITQRSFRNTFFPDRVFVKFKTYFSWSGTLSVGTSGTTQPIMGNGSMTQPGHSAITSPWGSTNGRASTTSTMSPQRRWLSRGSYQPRGRS